jgi:hypothetical protein
MIAALRLRRRRAPDFHTERLALGLFGASADRWPRRNRLPAGAMARLGHFVAGVALGFVVALVLIWIAVRCP